MKKTISGLALAALGLLVSQSVGATPFTEVGDAGFSLATAQLLPGGTTSISGNLESVDVYRFSWDGGQFSAAANTNFDPMLSIFDLNGSVLAFNDDYFGLQSYVSIALAKGDYLLSIEYCCGNYSSPLSAFSNYGSSTGGNAYTINLGAPTTDVPEPASIALAGLGIAGLAMSRRKRT